MYPPAIYNKQPSEEILEGTVVWHVITDKGNEYWGYDGCSNNVKFGFEKFGQHILDCENETIVHMDIRFRTHIISLPPYKDGYFFARGVLGNPSEGTRGMHTIGYLENDQVFCKKLIIPELYPWSEEVRSIEQCKNGLIKRINPSTAQVNQSPPQLT